MPINVKDSNVWKEARNVYVKDSGVWKEATRVWVYDSGSWKLVHTPGFIVDADTRYTDITGLTYDVAYTNNTQDHLTYYADIPQGTSFIDYFMIGGGGSGGKVPSSNNGNWVGTGGGAAPIMYGRVKVNYYGPSYIRVDVAGAASFTGAASGKGAGGQYSSFHYAQTSPASLQSDTRVLVPGGMGGEPGDGTHRRPLYLGHGNLLTDLNPLNGFLGGLLGFINLISVGGSFSTSERRYYAMPAYCLYENIEGVLRTRITGTSAVVQDDSELDTHPIAVVWKEDSEWANRIYNEGNGTYSVSPTAHPLHPDNVWSDVTYENNYAVSCGMIVPEPPERATGYAGTFRGETNALGVPLQQQFEKTEGANVTGPILVSWDGGTPPTRSGASNGTDYGRGGNALASTGNSTSTGGTGGIVMLRFV